jgi:hypothetical protein
MEQAATAQAAREAAWASGRVVELVRVRASDRVPVTAQVVASGRVAASDRVLAMAKFAKEQVLTG